MLAPCLYLDIHWSYNIHKTTTTSIFVFARADSGNKEEEGRVSLIKPKHSIIYSCAHIKKRKVTLFKQSAYERTIFLNNPWKGWEYHVFFPALHLYDTIYMGWKKKQDWFLFVLTTPLPPPVSDIPVPHDHLLFPSGDFLQSLGFVLIFLCNWKYISED